MRSDSLNEQSAGALLSTYATIMHLLRSRGVLRSFNNPVADVTEWLVSSKLCLSLTPPSEKSYDALDSQGRRYQIKGRWVPGPNRSKQLSALRDLTSTSFDFLVAVIFDADFEVDYAALIPVAVVLERSKYRKHTNSHSFHFPRNTLAIAGVQDITALLRSFPPSTDLERRVLAIGELVGPPSIADHGKSNSTDSNS